MLRLDYFESDRFCRALLTIDVDGRCKMVNVCGQSAVRRLPGDWPDA
jgi:hypothetical protein